jgi:hypothetical protein
MMIWSLYLAREDAERASMVRGKAEKRIVYRVWWWWWWWSRSEVGGAHVIIASALPVQRSLRSLHHHHIASSAYTEDKPDKPPYSHAIPNK